MPQVSLPGNLLRGPTTDATFICLTFSGSYTLHKGAALSACNGYQLNKYRNGRLESSIPLTGHGTVARQLTRQEVSCIFSVAGLTVTVLTPGGVLLKGLNGVIGGVAAYYSCTA